MGHENFPHLVATPRGVDYSQKIILKKFAGKKFRRRLPPNKENFMGFSGSMGSTKIGCCLKKNGVGWFYNGVTTCGWTLSMCFVPIIPHPFFVMCRWSRSMMIDMSAYMLGVILYFSIVVWL